MNGTAIHGPTNGIYKNMQIKNLKNSLPISTAGYLFYKSADFASLLSKSHFILHSILQMHPPFHFFGLLRMGFTALWFSER
jgi:hypothetical protein